MCQCKCLTTRGSPNPSDPSNHTPTPPKPSNTAFEQQPNMCVAMAAPIAAASLLKKLFYHSPVILSRPPPKLSHLRRCLCITNFSTTTNNTKLSKKKNKYKQKSTRSNITSTSNRRLAESVVKRRTRSEKEFDEGKVLKFGDSGSHIPVMLGEVLEVFASLQLRSFVDCTLGAAGHSSAVSTSFLPYLQLGTI